MPTTAPCFDERVSLAEDRSGDILEPIRPSSNASGAAQIPDQTVISRCGINHLSWRNCTQPRP